MLPVLLRIPSKPIFILLLVLAVGLLIWNVYERRKNPVVARSSTPLYFVAAAIGIFRLGSGSFVPQVGVVTRAWESFAIHSYGTMLSLAVVLGWFLVRWFAKADGISPDKALAVYVWTLLWALFGARALALLTEFHSFSSPFDVLSLSTGGMVAYGGMIGGFFASWYSCRKRRISFLKWADVATPSVALGTAITRVGCLLYGCDYGRITALPVGIQFPKGSFAWSDHVANHQLPELASHSFPVHPTQIYESLASLLILGLLMVSRWKRKFSGQLFVTWVISYGLIRSVIEVFRGDFDRGSIGPLSTSQFIGLLSAMAAILWLMILRKQAQSAKVKDGR